MASLKPHKGTVTFSSDPAIRGRRVTATASTLNDMITYAYRVRYDQISGAPRWAETEHYDLDGKAEGEGVLTPAEAREMVKKLLADRFQLKVRNETQEEPMYALVVGKSGVKFQPSAPDGRGGTSVRGGEKGLHMESTRGTIKQIADQLSYTAGHPVIDRTGLEGYYVYTLDWFPENRTPPPDLGAPSMFTALQEQLGLKLEPTKGPVDKIVIERAERASEN